MNDATKVSSMSRRLGSLAQTGKKKKGERRFRSASEALVTALPDILALTPTSSLAVLFSLIAISSSRRGQDV
jgi:hypothetical protein